MQRDLLLVLQGHDQHASPQQAAEGMDTIELASWAHYGRGGFGGLVDPPMQSAVRRALAGLAKRGLVFRLGTSFGRDGRCRWRVPPPDMVVAAQRKAQARLRLPGA